MKKLKFKWWLIGSIVIILIIGSVAAFFIFKPAKTVQTELHQHSAKKDIWTCTMHPQVISDKPGQCPICGMDLVRKNSDDNPVDSNMKNIIKLNDNKLVLANVSTYHVHLEKLNKKITAYSYMDFADQNRKVITAKFNGRIEKLYVNKTGENISKAQVLFEVYSPDLVQAQNEYVIAMNNSNQGNVLNSARKKLLLFGMTSEQIKELENSKEINMTVKYHSPYGGTIIEKKVQEGMYINEGMNLFDIADLSLLWNIAEVFEDDISAVKLGSKVDLTIQSYPGEKFNGKVSFIYPVVNSQSRTIKVRSDFTNHGGMLKPQMYGELTFKTDYGDGFLVPSDAILFLGKRNVVWLKVGDGIFEPREVKIGIKINDSYQIISGLSENDEIALTGGFLIDSESQLKSGMTTGHQHGGSTNSKSINGQNKQQNEQHKNH